MIQPTFKNDFVMTIHFDQTCLLWWLFRYKFHWQLRSFVYSSQFLLTENALFQAKPRPAPACCRSSTQKLQKKRENAKVKTLEFGILRLIRILRYFRSRLWIWKKKKVTPSSIFIRKSIHLLQLCLDFVQIKLQLKLSII